MFLVIILAPTVILITQINALNVLVGIPMFPVTIPAKLIYPVTTTPPANSVQESTSLIMELVQLVMLTSPVKNVPPLMKLSVHNVKSDITCLQGTVKLAQVTAHIVVQVHIAIVVLMDTLWVHF